ncbi:MAG: hypothetical protein LBH42_03485 [Treponema sp.]|nr:hypothetical protein [Treponema sp.]
MHSQTWDLPFLQGEFNINLYRYHYMIMLENPVSEVETMFAFTNRGNDFELRYTLFAQTEFNVENIQRYFALFVLPIINKAAGFEVDPEEVELFDERDVYEEFNGDIGVSAFIPNPPSDYGGGYVYMLLNFFYKMDQGIVMQAILFDDIDFYVTNEFDEILHSFRFTDELLDL